MEEYLRRVQSTPGEDALEGPIHAVLGGPEPDVDTVAATLCLALHLSQKEPSGGMCVPVLCGRRHDAVLPGETVRYLQRVKICERSLLWREDVDLVKLHHTGKLRLTLLRDGLLHGSEYLSLESSILRVVHHDGQQGAADDGASSALTTVTREILQEAAEHIGAVLGETLGEALRLQSEALWSKHGRQSAQLEELIRSLEQCGVTAGQHDETKPQDLEALLTMELKEFSDGEMTVALTSVTTDKEDWRDYVEGLKSFSERYGYDGLVVLLSINNTLHHPRQQVAVYSNNSDILNQICCELEESSSWSLSGELDAKESLQVYHIPINTSPSGIPPLLLEEIQGLLKEYVDRRSTVLACQPSSRTSSTEGVAGSVEFSQGSSGINDMDGSDIERAEGGNGEVMALARAIGDGEEDTGGVGVGAGGELVSPDSGMTTIRSSRSSKESSVFLSDDSPVGEVIAGGGPTAGPAGHFLRNPTPIGLSSLSPPVPPERRKHRSSKNKSDNYDLFSFDPQHSSDHSLQTGGESANSRVRRDKVEKRTESSSFSELEELSFLDFSASNSLGRPESRNSSIDHHGQINRNDMMDTMVPPTPVNSVVGSRPPSSCGVRFFPEDVVERISGLQHKDSVSSSLSETWDELGFDTPGAMSSGDNNAWNRTKEHESPQDIMGEVRGTESIDDMIEQESSEEIFQSENIHQRRKSLEPQLSLVMEQDESYDNWNPDSIHKDQWNTDTLAYLQLTPPEDEVTGISAAGIIGVKQRTSSLSRKKTMLNTLTPETSKEEDEGTQRKKGERQIELLDFWTYSAQKGFLKSDSGTSTSYPESLDMWNMTIRDDSLSPLTTPDNLSETSGSFSGVNNLVGAGTSVESPLGFSDGGMAMWNTTIHEDSSSTITSPEGPENGKDLMGSSDATDSPEAHASKQEEEENTIDEDKGIHEVHSRTLEHNVKIVILAAEGIPEGEETGFDDIQSQSQPSEDGTLSYYGSNMYVPGMVASNSEYDNVGEGTWSRTSSPETSSSPIVDMIQLEGQSSPFVTVTKPIEVDEKHFQYHKGDSPAKAEYRALISDKEQPANQMFLFEGTNEFGDKFSSGESSIGSKYDNERREMSEEADWIEQPSDHSPFVLVDYSTVAQDTSNNDYLSPGEDAAAQIQTDRSLSTSLVDWENCVSKKDYGLESTSLSHNLSITVAHNEDVPATESQGDPTNESTGNADCKTTTLSLSSSSGGERDTLKYSPGSRDELRSNSDGDSSGLEMEYIIVSGTVKEAEREWHNRPRQGERQSKGARKSMETFSMLSYAAKVLQTQAQAHREYQENIEQRGQNQTVASTDSALGANTEYNQSVVSTQQSLDSANVHHVVPEITQMSKITPSQSKNNFSPTRVEEENYDDKSNIVARSVSPSLRYPSDHFLKTREEVYVHSQISMEDSDEGGQSPPAPLPCPTSFGDLQVWRGQLGRQDTPQTTSEPQSPVLTNSSFSHNSSSICTPLSESGISTERGLGLPFSGDLMEEENDEEEAIDIQQTTQSKWTSQVQGEMSGQQLGSSDLLSFTEELIGGSSFQQTDSKTFEPKRDRFLQNAADYCDEKAVDERTVLDCDHGDYEASQDRYSPVLRGHQDMTSNGNAAYQWKGSENVTQGQTQYGYNYHHIDQRTENQSAYPACTDTKSNSQPNATDVYAEFTTDATAMHYGSEQADNYFEPGTNADYSLDDPGSKFQYIAESQYGDDSNSMCTSELQCSQDQAVGQSQHETDHAHYQFEEQPFYQSDVQPERGDHAQYMPEEYVHFLLDRHSEQGEGAAGTMMTMASNLEAAEEMDNREDPTSSADLSSGSNQRRKLTAPPINVSLEHSEGSLLSEDALDTEDEGLDTGDDLDVNLDEMDTPDEADLREDSEGSNMVAGAASSDATAEHRAAEESRSRRLWRSVVIGEQEHRIDMKCIEPYKRVISHGGYYAEHNAIIVFAACFLPDSNCDNYNYVMENLFLYVISTLELMVAEDYMIVYLNGATPRRRMPGFTWMKKCYQMIDRRLKKNLKSFVIVHPSWFIRTLLGITRPFISSKFSSKIQYVNSLQELGVIIPMEYVYIPPSIVKYDEERGVHKIACLRADKKGNSVV